MRNIETASAEELIHQFVELSLRQYKAGRGFDTRAYNTAYSAMEKITQELKRRPGDQRSVLAGLFDNPNPQVRLMAAHATLAIFPAQARAVIQSIADSKMPVQGLAAGMTLSGLDAGRYKPK